MYSNYKRIDLEVAEAITAYEESQFEKFKKRISELDMRSIYARRWNFKIKVYRWYDNYGKRAFKRKEYDGYTAMLQIDFMEDDSGRIVEIDESVCSFFENITYISFDSIRRKYTVFQNDSMEALWREVSEFVLGLE